MNPRMAVVGWPLRRWLTIVVLVMTVVVGASCVLGAFALTGLSRARTLVVDQIDPASRQTLALSNALVNEETGVQGYVLTGRREFLQPYFDGQQQEAAAVAGLRQLLVDGLASPALFLDGVERAAKAWRIDYAEPAVHRRGDADTGRGKVLFDQVRSALTKQETRLADMRGGARVALSKSASQLTVVGLIVAVSLFGLIALLTVLISVGMIRPVSRLVTEVRRVAGGQVQHEVRGTGPREIVNLGADVEAMRRHIVTELDTLQRLHSELTRSNSELEQFAYVASHDLQEPLRKVASFCQLLQRRYAGQLDERADQYIEFAVDGAKRMQVLINDLLAFSRVSRSSEERVVVDCNAVLAQAEANLAAAIEDSGARITAGALPSIYAELSLLTMVFQNLLSNAVKFHAEEPPQIDISAERTGQFWTFTCTDNGLGIEAQYAERIFVIFQRLHPKSAYPGTGIGLAMCRKIVEYHGGRIWLDTETGTGTTFRFTLPAMEAANDGSS